MDSKVHRPVVGLSGVKPLTLRFNDTRENTVKKIELTPRQRQLWVELCESVGVDPVWLERTMNEYNHNAEAHGLIEMDDSLLNAKYEFGWVEHAVKLMSE